MFSGDLLNQITASNSRRPGATHSFLWPVWRLFDLYGGVDPGGMAIDGGFAQRVLVGASSHYQAAERQYRYPTELQGYKPPTAQRTVTGAAAVVLGKDGPGPFFDGGHHRPGNRHGY